MSLNVTNGVCAISSTISVNIIPNVAITAGPPLTVICVGKTANLFANGATSYSWSINAPGLNTYSSASVIASPLANTVYSVYGMSSSGCNSDTKTVVVTVLPGPTVTAIGQTVCLNVPAKLNAFGADLFVWNGPDSFISSTSSVQIPASASVTTQVYTLTGTSVNSCSASVIVNAAWVSCVGLNAQEFDHGIMIYPNPVGNELFVHTTSGSNYVAEIFDVTGKRVLHETVSGAEVHALDTECLQTGIYIVRICVPGSEQKVLKIVKE